MTQPDGPAASIPAPAPRRRRRWPSVLLVMLAVVLVLVGMAAGHDHDSCCAIDCEAYPEVCAENAREHARQQQTASVVAFGAYVGAAAALGYAIVLLGRR